MRIRSIGPILFCLAVLLLPPPVRADSTAAQFRHGPDHAGVFADPGPRTIQRLRWLFQTGNRMIASPVVADGTVFVGGMDGRMYAIALATGQARWQTAVDAPISATAAVAKGTVYVQSDANTLYALRVSDGAVIWRQTTGPSVEYHNFPRDPDISNWDYYVSSPLYIDGRVYIGSGDSHIYAFDAQTGARLWAVKTGSRVRATPAADGKTVYIGGFDGVMYALDPKTGTRKWTFKTAGNSFFPVGEIQSSAALADGLVLFGSRDGYLYALEAASGRLVWKNSHDGSWVIGSPAVAGGQVCVGGSDDFLLRCNDLKTGRTLQSVAVGNNVFSSPVIADGVLFVGVIDGQIVRMTIADGHIASYRVDERIYASPWIEGDALIISVNDGSVRAYSADP